MMDNPMDKLEVLRARLAEKSLELGLTLENLIFVPGTPHGAQGIFVLDPTIAFKTKEERDTDDIFKDLTASFKQDELKDKIASIKKGGKDLLREIEHDDGIGLGDELEGE